MKKLNSNELRAVDGGAYCKYCKMSMSWTYYLWHCIFDSQHIVNKKRAGK